VQPPSRIERLVGQPACATVRVMGYPSTMSAFVLTYGLGCSAGVPANTGNGGYLTDAGQATDATVCSPASFTQDLVAVRVQYRSEPPAINPSNDCWVGSFDGTVEFGPTGTRLRRAFCNRDTREVYDGPISDQAAKAVLQNLAQYCVIDNPPPCSLVDGQYFLLDVTSQKSTTKHLIGTFGECARFPEVRDAKGPAGALIAYLKTLGATSIEGDAGAIDAASE
jgi:hypothetical protein